MGFYYKNRAVILYKGYILGNLVNLFLVK